MIFVINILSLGNLNTLSDKLYRIGLISTLEYKTIVYTWTR